MKLGRDFSERAPNPEEAFKITKAVDIPLHPKWTHHWRETSPERFNALRESLKTGDIGKDSEAKKCLEDILATHKVESEQVKIDKNELKVIKKLLQPEKNLDYSLSDSEEIPELIQRLSGIEVRDQAPHYIGGRMGRPEKAERRTIKGKPQLLFPCGKKEGGRMRNLSASYENTVNGEKGIVKQSIIHNRCPECGDYSFFSYCRECNVSTEKIWFCSDCGKEHDEEVQECESCGGEYLSRYKRTEINVREMMDEAMEPYSTPYPVSHAAHPIRSRSTPYTIPKATPNPTASNSCCSAIQRFCAPSFK
jgi:DNA polymerase II large subunit